MLRTATICLTTNMTDHTIATQYDVLTVTFSCLSVPGRIIRPFYTLQILSYTLKYIIIIILVTLVNKTAYCVK
jgi:hypothetical protein